MGEEINKFSGKYRFLSNFYPAEVHYEGDYYPTVEHAFQAAKTLDLRERRRIAGCGSPGDAKKLGRRVSLREDWDDIKIRIMKKLLSRKFTDPELRKKLLSTKDADLIEGNTWGDVFWGQCGGKGRNELGKLLMYIRARQWKIDGRLRRG